MVEFPSGSFPATQSTASSALLRVDAVEPVNPRPAAVEQVRVHLEPFRGPVPEETSRTLPPGAHPADAKPAKPGRQR